MQYSFTFDYFITFLYQKKYSIDLPKKNWKSVYFICIFTLLYLCVLLLVVRQIILIFFIFIWQYSFPLKIQNYKTVIQTELWNSWTVPPLSHS